jgi:hypothetical protein
VVAKFSQLGGRCLGSDGFFPVLDQLTSFKGNPICCAQLMREDIICSPNILSVIPSIVIIGCQWEGFGNLFYDLKNNQQTRREEKEI